MKKKTLNEEDSKALTGDDDNDSSEAPPPTPPPPISLSPPGSPSGQSFRSMGVGDIDDPNNMSPKSVTFAPVRFTKVPNDGVDTDMEEGGGEELNFDGSDDDSQEEFLPHQSVVKQKVNFTPELRTSLRKAQKERILHRHLTKSYVMRIEDEASPALKRRKRDFANAQRRRKAKHGEKSQFGILGLYDHLAGVRTDIEWAEDAAWRRENDLPYLSWTDFDEAADSGFNKPFFTYILMIACTVFLILSFGVNAWQIESLKNNPMIGPSIETLIKLGARQTSLIVDEGEWWRLITPMVLHAGIIHYLLNMVVLYFIGRAIEQSHGFFVAALLFIVPSIGANILSAIFMAETPSVGASGGIFGLIGACLADILANWSILSSDVIDHKEGGKFVKHVTILLWLVLDIFLNLVIGFAPIVDNYVHLGGMVYGFLCGLTTTKRLSQGFFGLEKSCFAKTRTFVVRFLGIMVALFSILVTGTILFKFQGNGAIYCPRCRYVSCIPFPFWVEEDQRWWHCDDCQQITEPKVKNMDNFYISLSFICPDGEFTEFDLEPKLEMNTENEEVLTQGLPSYCREFCDSVFAG